MCIKFPIIIFLGLTTWVMHRLLYFCDNSNRISENAPGTIKEIGKKGLLLNIVNKGRKEISQWCKNPYRPMTRQIKN